jgi:phage baseplate assembly protein W
MDEAQVLGKGISFPPRIGEDGRMVWSAGFANIRESIKVILLTETHERLMLDGFGGGLGRFLFEPNTVSTHRLIQEEITQALTRWEPRIDLVDVVVGPDPEAEDAAVATITYKVIATASEDQVNLTVRLSR